MSRILFFTLLFILLTCGQNHFYGQKAVSRPQIVNLTETKNFDLNIYEAGTNTIALSINLNLKATYSNEGNMEKITVVFENDLHGFRIEYPLNYDEMSGLFNNDSLLPNFDRTRMYISRISLLPIYFW